MTVAALRGMGDGGWGMGDGVPVWQFLAWTLRLLPLAACLVPLAPQAQTRTVEILHADYIEAVSDSLGTVQELRGNVRMRQDTTTLQARQVTYYETRGEVVLSGDVVIVSGRDTLTSTTVTYDSNDKTAVARGDVRLGDGESVVRAPEMTYDSRAEFATFAGDGEIRHRGAVLTSPSGSYSSARRFASFDGPVRLVDSTGVLDARRGTYDARVRRADFAGDVVLRRPDASLDADSLVYFRRTERARAYGRVVLQRIGESDTSRPDGEGAAPADSSRRTFLFGEALVFDGQADTASARGTAAGPDGPRRDPLLLVLRADSTGRVDSTFARAPRIDAARTVAGADTLTVITAAGGARLWERRLAAVADSVQLVRQSRSDRVGLFGTRPSVWADGAQITGDSLAVTIQDGAVDSLAVRGSAFVARVDSTLGRLQQIAGGQMLGRFDGDALDRLSVWPNAEVLYFHATADGLLAGADQVALDSLSFRFRDGELREVGGYRDAVGTRYGPTNVPETLRLPGFAYAMDGAPTRLGLLGDGWEAGWLERYGPAPEDLAPPDAYAPADGDTPAPDQAAGSRPITRDQ